MRKYGKCYFLYVHKNIRSKVQYYTLSDQSVPLLTVMSVVSLLTKKLCVQSECQTEQILIYLPISQYQAAKYFCF